MCWFGLSSSCVMVQKIPKGSDLTKLAGHTRDPVTLGSIFPQRQRYVKNSVLAGFESVPSGVCRNSGAMNQSCPICGTSLRQLKEMNTVVRHIRTFPLLSLGPLVLREASCCVMRLLKQTYRRSAWQGAEASCQHPAPTWHHVNEPPQKQIL